MIHDDQYNVVVNAEEQYSIWPKYQKIPNGWHSIDFVGSKNECLDYIGVIWKDIRPLSLRKRLSQNLRYDEAGVNSEKIKYETQHTSLVDLLLSKQHDIVLPVESKDKLFEEVNSGYLNVIVLDTKGRTELNITIAKNSCPVEGSLTAQKDLSLCGNIELDYQKLKFDINLDLVHLKGVISTSVC